MLRVTETGTKTFSFKYKIRGTANDTARVTIGQYPEVGLEEAREKARGYRSDIRNGNDPRLEKIAKIKVTSTIATKTFEDVCNEYIESYSKPNLDSWKNDVQLLSEPRQKWGSRADQEPDRRRDHELPGEEGQGHASPGQPDPVQAVPGLQVGEAARPEIRRRQPAGRPAVAGPGAQAGARPRRQRDQDPLARALRP
ncbi:hypothetical protein BRDID11002_54070 [Bradyrhizobium diazoefficiens]